MEDSTPPANLSTQPVDVFIIGGGPAGSTAGAWLGKHNCKTLICEKEKFPRFHIGESLLPNGNRILQEIGVWGKIQSAGFIEKYAAEFTLPDRSQSVRNVFSEGLIANMDHAYQVERSRFDKILLDHAAASGCAVRQQTVVESTIKSRRGWTVVVRNLQTGEEQNIEAQWIIDASGRNCVMGPALGIERERIPYPGRFAIFNHFKGVLRSPNKESGDIIVLRLEDAWFWVIPISRTLTSVGVVAQRSGRTKSKESREAFFWRKVRQSSFLVEYLSEATAVHEFMVESDYSFSYASFGLDRVLLTGDAASFIDPVFSSGVYLALESGLLAAKTIHAELQRKQGSVHPGLYRRYTKSMKTRIRTMRKMIEAYYDNSSFDVFMSPRQVCRIPQAINTILAGCVEPPFRVRWRVWMFHQICKLHKFRPFLGTVQWNAISKSTGGIR
jgi:flavin-dependent dehydrogenase